MQEEIGEIGMGACVCVCVRRQKFIAQKTGKEMDLVGVEQGFEVLDTGRDIVRMEPCAEMRLPTLLPLQDMDADFTEILNFLRSEFGRGFQEGCCFLPRSFCSRRHENVQLQPIGVHRSGTACPLCESCWLQLLQRDRLQPVVTESLKLCKACEGMSWRAHPWPRILSPQAAHTLCWWLQRLLCPVACGEKRREKQKGCEKQPGRRQRERHPSRLVGWACSSHSAVHPTTLPVQQPQEILTILLTWRKKMMRFLLAELFVPCQV